MVNLSSSYESQILHSVDPIFHEGQLAGDQKESEGLQRFRRLAGVQTCPNKHFDFEGISSRPYVSRCPLTFQRAESIMWQLALHLSLFTANPLLR
jgi:hypothetical protein